MERKIDGKNGLGRKRLKNVYQIVKDIGCGWYTEIETLSDRDVWRAALNRSKY